MAPRSFSEDGAMGAASPGDTPSGGGFGDLGVLGMSVAGRPGAPTVGAASYTTGSRSPDWSPPSPGGGFGGGGFSDSAFSYAAGGAIDEDPNASDPQGSMMGNDLQQRINAALGVVNGAMSYGRKLHGITGGDDQQQGGDEAIQTAGMPSRPGDQSESGVARPQPMPGPLPPTNNPFGKRAEGEQDDQSFEVAGMPSVPFSESQRERPAPGPLPPTNNPFGKRADAGDEAIPTDEEAA